MYPLLLTVIVSILLPGKMNAKNADHALMKPLQIQMLQIDPGKLKGEILAGRENNIVEKPGSANKLTLQLVVIWGAAVVSFLITCLAYLGYLNKRKLNSCLQSQQEKMIEQNISLGNLLSEKEAYLMAKDSLLLENTALLTEKDWLLRELQHRVKNNFHMIISLLNSQILYTKENAAAEAIKISISRVQAISLIHQKLTNNTTIVNIKSYVAELVVHLSDGLGRENRQIVFKQFISPINIPIAQVVSIGLILNEAVTNAANMLLMIMAVK
jgi:two-component sensor histidine kinase